MPTDTVAPCHDKDELVNGAASRGGKRLIAIRNSGAVLYVDMVRTRIWQWRRIVGPFANGPYDVRTLMLFCHFQPPITMGTIDNEVSRDWLLNLCQGK